MRGRDKLLIIILVGVCFALVFYRIHMFGFSAAGLLPQRHYELLLNMTFDGHDEKVRLRVALPFETDRQKVRNEFFGAPEIPFRLKHQAGNRWGVWERDEVRGRHSVVYSSMVRTEARRFKLPEVLPRPGPYATELQAALLSAKHIQSESKDIRNLYASLVLPEQRDNLAAIVRAVYQHTQQTVKSVKLKGTTDALTCLRLGEASCGGKSRLFVALCRTAGIPSRLVGGLIMKNGTWRSSHIWAEAWLAGRWIPFCPLNGYFAEIPAHYLTLYYGDHSLFTHTRDINFRYFFHGKTVLAPPAEALRDIRSQPAGLLNLWSAFEQVRIPLNLLKIILMIPFGALIVVLARNVAGIPTFGTFMPALLAVAFRDTGLLWGLILFASILIFGGGVRFALERFQLLHTPRLAVILTSTVLFMMGVTALGVATGQILATRVSLFPIVILTLTVERAAIITEEEGLRQAGLVALGTMLVVTVAYALMSWEILQVIVVTFPETLLLVVAVFFVVGRWAGIRWSEYLRFREFFFSGRNPHA